MAYREKNGIKRNDFLDLLIELKKEESLKQEIEENNVQPFGKSFMTENNQQSK